MAKTSNAKPKTEAEKAAAKKKRLEDNRRRFLETGARRAGKTLTAIGNLAVCARRGSYEYTKAEWDQITAAIDGAVASLKADVTAGLSATASPTAAAGPVFKFK